MKALSIAESRPGFFRYEKSGRRQNSGVGKS